MEQQSQKVDIAELLVKVEKLQRAVDKVSGKQQMFQTSLPSLFDDRSRADASF